MSVAAEPGPLRVLMVGADRGQRGGIATYLSRVVPAAPSAVCLTTAATHDEGSRVHRLTVFLRGWATVAHRSSRRTVDVVHVHVSDGGSLLRKSIIVLTARIAQRTVVVHAHGAEPSKSFRGRGLVEPFALAGLRRADVLIALSGYWSAWYRENWRFARCEVLRNPAPPVRCRSVTSDADPVTIVCLGRLGERKGTFLLLEAFADVPSDIRERARLTLAGDGEIERARSLAQTLGVGHLVECPGWLDTDGRDALLGAADAFVLPSEAEGLPFALLEAMAVGVTPVSTCVGGIDEVIHDGVNGLLVPAGDRAALTEALRLVIASGDMRARLARRAFETAADLNVHAHWAELLRIYAGASR